MTTQTQPTRAAAAPPVRTRDRLAGAVLSLISVGALAEHYSGLAFFGYLAIAAFLAFCLVGQSYFRLRERLLLTVGLALSAVAFAGGPEGGEAVYRALDRAAFLAAFMLLMGLLRDAAVTSPAVVESGRFLTRQPPGRRYLAIAGGSHVLTTLLNMGALNLLAPLIQAGVKASREAGEEEAIAAVKERRQFCANLRGFSTVIVWAPTTVTQALLISLFPAADPLTVILNGLGFAAIAFVAGWLEDRLRWLPLRRRMAREGRVALEPASRMPRRALRDFGLVCLALVALALAARFLFAVETVPALMLAAPILTVAWIFHQGQAQGNRVALGFAVRRVGRILGRSVPAASPEAFTLATAGFIGMMLAALVPSQAVTSLASPEVVHPLVLLAVLPLLVLIAVQFALTPIVMAVFLGTALSTLESLPAAPELFILALSGGWTLSLLASPFAASALILHRITGLSAARLTWVWNGLYALVAYLLLLAWVALLYLLL